MIAGDNIEGQVLACVRPTKRLNVYEALDWVRTKQRFVHSGKLLPKNRAFVMPYCLFFDGRDIMTLVSSNGVVSIGCPFAVKKPRFYFKTAKNFDRVVENTIRQDINRAFGGITVHEDPPRNLLNSDYDIISCNVAIALPDGMNIFPIYIAHIQSNVPISAPDTIEGGLGLTALESSIVSSPEIKKCMPTVSRTVAHLIGEGEIILPQNKEFVI